MRTTTRVALSITGFSFLALGIRCSSGGDVVLPDSSADFATQPDGFVAGSDMATSQVMLRLDSVTPRTAPLAGGTTVRIAGQQFSAGAIVRFGGTAATQVVVVSATEITAVVPAKKGAVGTVPVEIELPSGGKTSRADVFSYYSDNATFERYSVSTGLGDAAWITVADLNRDKALDVAIVGSTPYRTVKVLLGGGAKLEPQPETWSLGYSTIRLHSHDLDGDGRIDLIATLDGNPPGGALILQQNIDGSFMVPARNVGAGMDASYTAVADVNADGKLDLVMSDRSENVVAVHLAKGDGTYLAPVKAPLGAGKEPWAVALGDLNGDGKLDAVTANGKGNSVSILAGKGDGGFEAPKEIPIDRMPRAVRLADMNRDGRLDIVAGNYEGLSVSVLLGKGDGTFPSATRTAAATCLNLWGVELADFNGDEIPDVMTSCYRYGGPQVLLGKGDGSLQSAMELSIASSSGNLSTVGDVTLDGLPDIITAQGNGSVTVYVNKTAAP